ncbi:hypothetical protein NCS56_00635000 [Fusarium sp. Ph1]|nr:hypothetical protein NCS56_00635000 [Fusarium sp. Ph1]
MLYPTKHIHLAVESLYAVVLDFLLIAHSWCNESKLRHAYHSFTRPHEIQYKDLLERITDCTNTINELADVGAQTEIRVMHTTHTSKLNEIIKALQACESDGKRQMDGLICSVSRLEVSTREIDKKLNTFTRLFESSGITINDLIARVENFYSMHTSAQLDTNQTLSELQLSQALHNLSQHFEDPEQCLKHHIFLRNRRVSGQGPTTSTNEFWRSPRLAKLSLNNRSSLAIIKGTFKLRSAIQDFGLTEVKVKPDADDDGPNEISHLPSIEIPWGCSDGEADVMALFPDSNVQNAERVAYSV